MKIILDINEEKKCFEIEPTEKLICTLRNHGYKSIKFGCGEGTCGTCTVLVDGKPHLSCLTFTAQMENKKITTLEGLGNFDNLHPLQQSFIDEGAVQCGYCTPGMILSAKALLDKNPSPSDEEIKKALDGNKCRCTGYVSIINAIRNVAAFLN